jgi:hypothetical protein
MASFSFPLIIGSVILMIRRNRNKILGSNSKKEEKSRSTEFSNDTELNVMPNSEDKISKVANASDATKDLEYDKKPPKSPMLSDKFRINDKPGNCRGKRTNL